MWHKAAWHHQHHQQSWHIGSNHHIIGDARQQRKRSAAWRWQRRRINHKMALAKKNDESGVSWRRRPVAAAKKTISGENQAPHSSRNGGVKLSAAVKAARKRQRVRAAKNLNGGVAIRISATWRCSEHQRQRGGVTSAILSSPVLIPLSIVNYIISKFCSGNEENRIAWGRDVEGGIHALLHSGCRSCPTCA